MNRYQKDRSADRRHGADEQDFHACGNGRYDQGEGDFAEGAEGGFSTSSNVTGIVKCAAEISELPPKMSRILTHPPRV